MVLTGTRQLGAGDPAQHATAARGGRLGQGRRRCCGRASWSTTAGDLGQVGEVTEVNREFLEMLLAGGYVPVISPVGLGDDGPAFHMRRRGGGGGGGGGGGEQAHPPHRRARGSPSDGELQSELTAADLEHQLADGAVAGGLKVKVQAILTRAARRGGAGARHRRPRAALGHRRALHRPRRGDAGDAAMRLVRDEEHGTRDRGGSSSAGCSASGASPPRTALRVAARPVRPPGDARDALPRPGRARRPAGPASRGRRGLRAARSGPNAATGAEDAAHGRRAGAPGARQRLAGGGAQRARAPPRRWRWPWTRPGSRRRWAASRATTRSSSHQRPASPPRGCATGWNASSKGRQRA